MNPLRTLDGKRILLGVSGSIAAYKAVDVLRRLMEQGADVIVIMTKNAERFVSRLTFQTLSGNQVPDPVFQDWNQPGVGHVDITNGLDIALVAPATANIIGKVASGIADDTLTTTLLAIDCPLIMAPAMNDRMFRNQSVTRNISLLREQGVQFVEPGTGSLACGTVGQGRLADTDLILQAVSNVLPAGDLAGVSVLVTAGPTREQIDAVRFISNPSTGKMGFALADAARRRGADVILVTGTTEIKPPSGLNVISVKSAADMHRAVMEHAGQCGIVIMAAAVSDFKPVSSSDRKIKKQDAPLALQLERTEDILASVSRMPGKRLLVGFAAETDDLEQNAVKKLKDKNLDLIVANNLLNEGAGFACDTNTVTLFGRSGSRMELPLMPKSRVADHIMDAVISIRKNNQ